MATSSYRLKTNKDWNSIYFRFKQGDQFDKELSTGLQVPKNRWSPAKQEILTTNLMDYTSANIKLKEFQIFINKEFQDSKIEGETITTKWLKEKIGVFFNRETNNPEIDNKTFFTNFIDAFIEESKTKRSKKNTPIRPRTIQHYKTTQNKIFKYEEHIGKKLKLTDIDLKFHTKFIDFLENKHYLNPNTIGGYIDDIKLFCGNADKKDYKVSKDYKLNEFYTPSNSTNDIYLNPIEIQKIYEKEFTQDYLDNARDWLIIGMWTGLRVSDLLKLTPNDIIDGFIYNTNEKTDYPAIIPIHEQVQSILNKRKGKFPREIADQNFNKYIKEVCKKAGLTNKVRGAKMTEKKVKVDDKDKIHRKESGTFQKWELVSSHTCRRSFATNLYGKIDTLTIMKIIGHKTESQFLSYIKITPIEYAKRLKEHWNKYIS